MPVQDLAMGWELAWELTGTSLRVCVCREAVAFGSSGKVLEGTMESGSCSLGATRCKTAAVSSPRGV